MTIYDNILTHIGDAAEVALSDYPGTPVIISHTNGSELPEDYAALYPLGISQIGRRQVSTLAKPSGTEYLLHIQANYEVRTQFTFVGGTAFALANSFNQKINNSPLVIESLARNKLTVMRKGNILSAPQKRETGWVEAFTLDVHFGFAIETQQAIDTVGTVVLVDTVTGETYTITI